MRITKTQAAVVFAALGVIWISLTGLRSQHAVTSVADVQPSVAPVADSDMSEQTRATLESLARELALLKRRTTLLEANVELLGVRPLEDDNTRDPTTAPEAPKPQTREEYLVLRQRSFEAEPVDHRWADENSDGIHVVLSKLPTMRGALRSLHCRAQSCRLELDQAGAEGLAEETMALARQLASSLPAMDTQEVDVGNGQRRLIVYLSAANATL